jgi:2-polyprenyl-3-methyl-5-hydroxy-6-metoxy-1,4-benzoquinol methylase
VSDTTPARQWSEISDEIVAFDPVTLARLPVRKSSVVQHFSDLRNRRAARIVEAMPEADGYLDPVCVDRLLVSVHCEMQRISEEFQHGQRALELLRPVLTAVKPRSSSKKLRVVDIGCGTGYIIRWLATHGNLGPDIELIGVDYHEALVNEARRLAEVEGLNCAFKVANAFRLDPPGAIYLSTGVVHHFRDGALREFFAQHERPETLAFLHFDFLPSALAPFGSWLFHTVRMRSPLAKHDGLVSAIRAHPGATLLSAARSGTSSFALAMFNTRLWGLPIPRAFHTVIGIRHDCRDAFVRALGRRTNRLGEFQ